MPSRNHLINLLRSLFKFLRFKLKGLNLTAGYFICPNCEDVRLSLSASELESQEIAGKGPHPPLAPLKAVADILHYPSGIGSMLHRLAAAAVSVMA